MADKLAVINTAGEVWARDLDLAGSKVGAGVQLTGPGLFGGTDDQFVVASGPWIAVITKSGAYWPRRVQFDNTIGSGMQVSGSLFGGPDTKYVLYDGGCQEVYVVNTAGEVWTHTIASQNGNFTSVGLGQQMNGPSLFGSTNPKYVVLEIGSRILVINAQGEVWAYDISISNPTPNQFQCGFNTVSAGQQLTGPGLFGAPNDKYVAFVYNSLLVINTLGEVWAHNITDSAVGSGNMLNGPGLFGGTDDKYVVTYSVEPPPQ
jgi:hypothetical protein